MTIVVVQGAAGAEEVPGIERLGGETELRFATTAVELGVALPGAEVLLGWDFTSADLRSAWDRARDLRWIHWGGVGVDAVLFPELAASGVVLTNSRGVFDRAMAETVLGLIIAFAKALPETLALQARREWRHRLTERIEGSRVLVVGVGSIGRTVARLLRAAGMRVSGVGRTARDGDPDFDTVHGSDALITALANADYVVLVAPLTERTARMFGRRQFRAMKPGARFINVGRGPTVDEAALVEALDEGAIAGAALDVFEAEPLADDSPLWSRPNVIVSPHMSGDFIGYPEVLVEQFIANFRRWRAGEPLLNVVDKTLGFVPAG